MATKLSTADKNKLDDKQFAFPEERKEPLVDAKHVRNAVSRFDQVEGVTDKERDRAWRRIKAAAKKFGVDIKEKSWHELSAGGKAEEEEDRGEEEGEQQEVVGLQHDDRPQDLAALHAGEGLLDLVDADRLADEAVEVEPPVEVEVDQHGEVARGRQSPYQLGLSAPPRPKNSIIGRSMRMSGVGTPTCTSVPARSRARKACSITTGLPTASMQTSAPLPPVSA